MRRRHFLMQAGGTLLAGVTPAPLRGGADTQAGKVPQSTAMSDGSASATTFFLCGDVMTGRGIDQILPHPSHAQIFEPYVRSAVEYVKLAERANGPIARPVDYAYVWGDALAELDRMRPDARIVNLETAVTASDDAWPGKGIHYRMHPANVSCLTIAKLDCCALANNHLLDWGRTGLAETLTTLRRAGLKTAGAGRDEAEAAAPAIIDVAGGRRVLVFAFGMESAGIPEAWAATRDRAGVNLLRDLSVRSSERIARLVDAHRRSGDRVVIAIHWGANWGYEIPADQRAFARRLIDAGGADVVHGHSSHHAKGIEVYRGKPVLYGCGDFLNDYEGIGGYESYRGELALMYFPVLDGSGSLSRFTMTPTRTRRFRVERAGEEEARWLAQTLNREGERFGTRVERQADNTLILRWS